MGKRANDPHNDFLIDLIRAAVLGEAVPVPTEGCTPGGLAALIRRQHLTNLVYPLVMKTPELQALRVQLEKDYLIQIPKITNQQLEMQKWLDAADEKGLDCIPLKGFLLRQLYPSPLARSMTDLDILIRDMDRADVRQWMESIGYQAEETNELSHHDNFVKHPWMYMELHFHLMKPRPGRDELEKKVWEHATPLPGRKHIYQMSPEDFYIFHLLHLHKHFTTQGVGLKGVIDIHFLLKAYGDRLDQNYLAQELAALEIDRFAAYMEKLARILLGSECADADSKLVMDYMADCGIFGSAGQRQTIEMAQTKGKYTATRKLRYYLHRLFPGMPHMRKRFPALKRFPWLLPIFWLARPFLVLLKGKDSLKENDTDHTQRILSITGTHR
jgi:hypothetical protein